MSVFVSHKNVESDVSFGRAINKALKRYVNPELKISGRSDFHVAGIEVFVDGSHKVFFDGDVQISLKFKKSKITPGDVGKPITVDLKEIENVRWYNSKAERDCGKILIVRFNKDWWIWDTDFKHIPDLQREFEFTTTHRVRGGGYLPLNIRKQEKPVFIQGWQNALTKELPSMWRRHLTTTQRYRGVMVYDGNYFDLFSHAQELYILGYYYPSIIVCRTAAEQALIRILVKVGKGLEIYYDRKPGKKPLIKGIKDLIKACRDPKVFRSKYPINKTAEKRLNAIVDIANDLVHPKHDLSTLDAYKDDALKCMDHLQYVIKNHLNFVRDTGTISGYRILGSVQRLR